jgi:hypothetical protein
MEYIKPFIAGFLIPGIGLPFLIMFLLYFDAIHMFHYYPSHFIPIVWGVWNVVYFAIGDRCPIKKQRPRLFLHGAVLGILTALGMSGFYRLYEAFGYPQYLIEPFVIAPILYGVFWMIVVRRINKMLGLKDW